MVIGVVSPGKGMRGSEEEWGLGTDWGQQQGIVPRYAPTESVETVSETIDDWMPMGGAPSPDENENIRQEFLELFRGDHSGEEIANFLVNINPQMFQKIRGIATEDRAVARYLGSLSEDINRQIRDNMTRAAMEEQMGATPGLELMMDKQGIVDVMKAPGSTDRSPQVPSETFEPFQGGYMGGVGASTAPGYALGGLAKSPQTVSETMMAQNTSGGVPPGEARLLEQFNIILESGSAGQKRDFITRHMSELLSAAERDPTLVQRIMGAINSGVSQRALKEVSGNRGKLLAPPGPRGPVGKYQIYDDPSYPASPVGTNEYDAMAGMGSSFPGPSFLPIKGQTAPNFEALEEVRGPMAEFAHGGYVDRGTMAGELGRRGDLSVREAGETMYERNKRLHGYDRGGYVHDRGTMPGELHPKGSLSVRVAGESMGEYEKHREDEDDYRPVRRTLATALSPTLSRRMFG